MRRNSQKVGGIHGQTLPIADGNRNYKSNPIFFKEDQNADIPIKTQWLTGGALGLLLGASAAGAADLVSVNSAGTDSGNGLSIFEQMSPDERFVAFTSDANNLGATDTNGATDVFVRDRQTGTTTLVSVNSGGNDSGNGASSGPVISPDGRFAAFTSSASKPTAAMGPPPAR
jgi:hypothetical protein